MLIHWHRHLQDGGYKGFWVAVKLATPAGVAEPDPDILKNTKFEMAIQQSGVGQYVAVFDVEPEKDDHGHNHDELMSKNQRGDTKPDASKNQYSDFKLFRFDWTAEKGEAWAKTVHGKYRMSTSPVAGFNPGAGRISDISFFALKPFIVGDFDLVVGGFGVYK